MSTKEIKTLEHGLMKQRREVARSKKAATKLLKELNIFHLLVLKGSLRNQEEVIVHEWNVFC